MEDFFLDISYKNKTVRFKVVNPEAPLSTLVDNLRHAIGEDGRLILISRPLIRRVLLWIIFLVRKILKCMRLGSCAQGSVKRIRLSLIIMCIMGIWCI